MTPKYNDGKYHIEFDDGLYYIVNVYGESVFDEDGTMIFESWFDADKACDKLNEVSEGGLITNFQ